jgi:FAD/FMN-containing dehydrogenase/Fe-S oxidoreductase
MLDLAADLRRAVRGEVRFDTGSRALYATDSSNYRQVPIGVVVPRDPDDVVATIGVCRQHGAPILSRGGGTSLAGQCCNVAVVMDMSKYVNRVLDINPHTRVARVEPGVVLDTLRGQTARVGLTFGPDPATHNRCTLGGMLGNNSCGVHSVMSQFYGPGSRVSDNTHRLEIVTYDGLKMWVGPTSDAELQQVVAAGGRRGEIYAALRQLRDTYADLVRARYPKIPRRISGYNLDDLLPERGFNVAQSLVGSESTCVTILQAELHLIHNPKARTLVVLGYQDVFCAGDHVPAVLAFKPIGLEGMDDRLIDDMIKTRIHPASVKMLPEGRGWLLVEFGGETQAESNARAQEFMGAIAATPSAPAMRMFDDVRQQHLAWKARESGLPATAHVPGQPPTWEGFEDSAVAPERIGDYMRDLRKLFARHGYTGALYGHFGDGCIHTRLDFDLESTDGIARYRAFMDDATSLVVSYGGSLSGEHGDGQSRAQFLSKMFGPELVDAFRQFKAIWDPQGKMNPGKVVDPYRTDENLRLGADYRPSQPATHFAFQNDRGSLSFATLRCVGVGECRRDNGGTMCPSYKVTREEAHSTRGRAHLLFEMLRGDALTDGWKDEHVKEALDLCLACKGCRTECPVSVDVATYKAEFLSHYYEGRRRPASAYAMGFVHRWARLASIAPRLVNALAHAPGLTTVFKKVGGISPQREIPRFAARTFVDWFRSRSHRPSTLSHQPSRLRSENNGPSYGEARRSANGAKAAAISHDREVLLWPDTFNNHFHPETAIAATEVLEAAGFTVSIPSRSMCCGRPLYDYGFLTHAKALLRDIMAGLEPAIRAGTPIVVLEPSCLAVFRDELVNLFPQDDSARRLSKQTFLLAEFLRQHGTDALPARVSGAVMLHGHCHHKAVAKIDDEEAVLRAAGASVDTLDSGCCGMAGSFGFESEHYDLSMQVGELVLLPAVRGASAETLIVADGFSCREQIRQATGRRAVHLAEALRMGLR